MNVKGAVSIVIVVLVALILLPIILVAVDDAQTAIDNATSTSHTLVGLIPLFYILAVMLGAVAWAVSSSRDIA